jgi:hypothetical protein
VIPQSCQIDLSVTLICHNQRFRLKNFMKFRKFSCAARLACCALAFALITAGQINRSSLTGTVTDAQGARVPGVVVRLTQSAISLSRSTHTGSQGEYYVDTLPVGEYIAEFSRTGFGAVRVERVVLTAGETRTLNTSLGVASAQQQTEVTEALIQLDRTDASIGALIEQKQVSDLPINGRNWATLTSLVPGATDVGAGDQRTIRFVGHGLDDNNLTLDGVDATAVFNQEQREYMRLNIPLDSISQFQAQSQNFGADVVGGTAGGQVSVVSPSGTNAFHSGVFEYLRNSVLDARSPFNRASPSPFQLNQFGAAFGGPIVHGHTFFYANYEGLRQRLENVQIGLVPSPNFISSAAIQSPALLPILNAYPKGTSPTSNANVWNYVGTGKQIDNEDSGMFRVDQHFNNRTTAFLRFNQDEAVETTPTGQLNALTKYDTTYRNGVAELTHVLTPTLVNDAKFGFNQTVYHTANLSPLPYTITVSNGFSPLTGASTTDYPSRSLDLLDDLSWSKGRHTIKLGFQIRWIALNQGTSQNGALTYNSPGSFAANLIGNAAYTAILPLKRQRKAQYWGYVQDEWKATPNLTITAGVRYNYFNVLHEINYNAIPFDLGTCGGYCSPYDTFSHPRSNDFDPRIGIAWSHRDTVLRVGGGIYHTDGQEDDQNLPISNTVARYSFSNTKFPTLSFPLTPFLIAAQNAGAGVVSPRDLDRNRKDDYVAAWTASVQQKLPFNIVGMAAYLGNKGTDLLTTTYVNLINPVTGVRPYPAFGPVSWRGNVGNSTFHALQFNAQRQFQGGFLLSANYMWSHSINDGSIGGGDSDTPQNSFCRSCDKGDSDFDLRQIFNLSAVYHLPFGASKRYLTNPGLLRAIFSNFELSSISSWQTGLPVNVTVDRPNPVVPGQYATPPQRPTYNYGVSITPPGGSTPTQWINPAAFSIPAPGIFGNLGRNAVRAPGIWQVDLGLSKYISVTEHLNLRFRVDGFNTFNRAQYGVPNSDLSLGNFGVITTPVNAQAVGRGRPREFQLSVKLNF